MPKNILEDIKPSKKEPSAFFLELSKTKAELSGKKINTQTSYPATNNQSNLPPPSSNYKIKSHFTPGPKKSIWIIAIICLLGLFVTLSFVFAGATVTLTPKTEDISLADSFNATKNSVDGLSFQLVSLSGEQTIDVTSSGSTTASVKATGTVMLYNNYSSKPQPLLINTRLADPAGKIYFTNQAITIPGKTTVDSTSVPGSSSVTITAAEAGPDYNQGPTDFSLIGFKGTSKYEDIYGRSTTPLQGGSEGPVNTITPDEAAVAQSNASGVLEDTLTKEAQAQIPDGFILFKGATFFSTDTSIPTTLSSTTTNIPVTINGTLSAFLFKRSDLTSAIVQKDVPGYDNSPVTISNLDQIGLNIQNKDLIDPTTVEGITLNLSGSAHVVWAIDTSTIVSALEGQSKSDFENIMANFPNIQSAHASIWPFWKFSFPQNPTRINIINLDNS